jgi:hypothetical protein
MKIEREECERKVNEVFEKMNEVKEWFDSNWDSIGEEGRNCWENFVENIKDII